MITGLVNAAAADKSQKNNDKAEAEKFAAEPQLNGPGEGSHVGQLSA